MLWIIIMTVAFLVLVASKKKRTRTEKLEIGTNSLVYLLEIQLVTSIIVNLLFNHDTFLSFENLFQLVVLRDYVFAYTLYQLILLVSFKIKDSIDIDANNALKSIVDRFQLFGEFDKEVPTDVVERYRREMNEVFFNDEQQELIEKIFILVSDYNKTRQKDEYRLALKSISIDIDMQIKISNYGWMQSVFLRILK